MIKDNHGSPAASIIDKIQKGIIPASSDLRKALSAGILQVLDGHIKEKALYIEYLKELQRVAINEGTKKSINDSTNKLNRFTEATNNDKGLSGTDIKGFKDYYQNTINKGEEFEIGHKDASISSLNWQLIAQYSNKLNKSGQGDLFNKLRVLSAKVDKLTLAEIGDINKSEDSFQALVNMAAGDTEIDVSIARRAITDTGMSIVVEIEPKLLNQAKGKLSGKIAAKVKKLTIGYTKQVAASLEKELKSIDLANTRFSPSFTNDIDNRIAAAFLGNALVQKRTEKKVIKKKKSTGNKSKIKSKVNQHKRLTNTANKLIAKVSAYKRQAPVNFSTLRVTNLINGILAENVRKRMGKSGDLPIKLRNQTGRFSESAQLLTLTRTKSNTLLGTYTYMRYPYDVFLPGNKLGNQIRDPRVYIEGAIRQSAEKLLGKNFPGLQMELV